MKIKIKIDKAALIESANCHYADLAHNCAVAVVVRQVFKNACVSNSHINTVYSEGGNFYSIKLPEKVAEFIARFDRKNVIDRLAMDELEFEVEVPDGVIDSINIDEIKEHLKSNKVLKFEKALT